jgi:hypothetical protein
MDTIGIIERKPHPGWFMEIHNEHGESQWMLRFDITGLQPKLYGPFNSQHNALLWLDSALDKLLDTFCDEIDDNKELTQYMDGLTAEDLRPYGARLYRSQPKQGSVTRLPLAANQRKED